MDQNQRIRLGILGAGLGSRLKNRAKAKPLALLEGRSLLWHLTGGMRAGGIDEIFCALRDELLSPEDKSALPPGLRYLFVNTESSLHTLVELVSAMAPHRAPVLFSMADTVLRREDLVAFLRFCGTLEAHQSAVLVTTFVDDEKPLWVHLDEHGNVQKFSAEPALHVTSGMYLLQPQAMEIAKEVQAKGVHKMRNFLGELAARGEEIKTFVVAKTIDVDHPSDLEKAADFLRSD